LTRNPKLKSNRSFRLASSHPPPQFLGFRRVEGVLAPNVGTLPELCNGDPLSLTFPDEVSFKLSECPHHVQKQMRHGRIFSRKGKILLLEANIDAPLRQGNDQLSEVVQVPGEPVHRMTKDRIPLSHVAEQLFELWPVDALSGSFIDKTLVEGEAVQLTQFLFVSVTLKFLGFAV